MFMEIHISVNIIKEIEPKQKFISSTKCRDKYYIFLVYFVYFCILYVFCALLKF